MREGTEIMETVIVTESKKGDATVPTRAEAEAEATTRNANKKEEKIQAHDPIAEDR